MQNLKNYHLDRKLLSIIVAVAMVISMFAWTAGTANAAQTGANDININTAQDLADFAADVNNGNTYLGSTVTLTASIDLRSLGVDWTPIGLATIGSDPGTNSPVILVGGGFAGTFEGGGNTISNLTINTDVSGYGLFGYLAPAGTIQNLTVSGTVTATAAATDAIGGVVAYNSGIINHVTNNASVAAANSHNVGGIAGFNNGYYGNNLPNGIITNCQNTGAITGLSKAGGITGENAGVINSCSNAITGVVTNPGSGKNGAGGIAGRNGNNDTALEAGEIFDCYNAAPVSTSDGRWGGGIVGFENALSTTINCYDVGAVTGYEDDYPIIGSNENPAVTVLDNYSLDSIPPTTVEDDRTGTRKDQIYMQSVAFAELLETKAYGDNVWAGAAGVYPALTYTAPVPPPSGGGTHNDYAVIYLSHDGDDESLAPDAPATPVATLGKAVALADQSSVAGVYVNVLDTIDFAATQSIFGNGISVQWHGSDDTMFTVVAHSTTPVNLTLGGLKIDGEDVDTVFAVEGNASAAAGLTLRNNTSIDECGTAIDMVAYGNLTLNQSTIGGTNYSVRLEDSTDTMTIFTGPGQSLDVDSVVYLADGDVITLNSALTSDLTVETEDDPADGEVLVAVAADSDIADASVPFLQFFGSGVDFVADGTDIYAVSASR
ncbi:MAG: hypothetical protein LBT26_11485 [Clostridiales Family XIII bacterium]|jgi:hypothetical protein|nr:hypothetical protein [Clostridiales Family XIII bacterium]